MGGRGQAPVTGTREAVRTLNPGYFALVMASGMVSTAMYHQHAPDCRRHCCGSPWRPT